jgi:hypothetical protein
MQLETRNGKTTELIIFDSINIEMLIYLLKPLSFLLERHILIIDYVLQQLMNFSFRILFPLFLETAW